MKNPARLAFCSLLFFFSAKFVSAQNNPPKDNPAQNSSAQQTSASPGISGRVTDSAGYGIPDVAIFAQRDDSPNTTLLGTTSVDGKYSVHPPPGNYKFKFDKSGFTVRELPASITENQNGNLDARLQIQPISASVVVTASPQPIEIERTAAPVDLITRHEMDQRQSVSLADLLSTQTGISYSRTGPIGGLTTVFIDGGDSNFTKVLVDGTPVNEPGGNINFANFTVDNIDKVEIVHGAESALYGTDAASGVIQIITHRGTTRIPEVNLFAEGGGFSSARGGAQLSGLLEKFDYSAAASYFNTDGQGINDRFLNRTFSGNFGYGFSDSNQLRLSVRSNSSFNGLAGQTLLASQTGFPADPDSYDNLKQLAANLSWNFKTGEHWTHKISAAESRIVDKNAFPAFDFTALDQFNRAGLVAQSTYAFRQGAATAGYQYEVENGYPSALSGVHARRNNQAGFLDARWSPLPRLTLSAGARAEDNANFGTRVVPRAGIIYGLRYAKGFVGDTRLRFAYGQGIEEPTLYDSFSTDPCTPGNPGLRPERSRTFNTGVDQFFDSDRLRFSATYFANQFRDLITETAGTFSPACPFGTGTFFNTDLSRARGVNFSTQWRLVRWFSLGGNFSHDETRVLQAPNAAVGVETVGNHLLRRPVNSGNLMLNANYRKFNLNLAGYFTGRRTDSDFFGLGYTHDPGYARLDLATSYYFGRGITGYGRVTNLTDKQYQEALGWPALGRDYRIGMNYRFGGRD